MDRLLTGSGLLVLVGLSCYIAGRMISLQQFAEPSFRLRPDTRPRIPVVQFEGIQEGNIVGHLRGDVRVFWGDQMMIPDGSGAFRITAEDLLLTEEVAVRVPDGMPFVASRNGKKYYPVHARMGERIKPENRRYFPTAEEAENAGFLP